MDAPMFQKSVHSPSPGSLRVAFIGGYNVSEEHAASILRVALTLKIQEAYSSEMVYSPTILHLPRRTLSEHIPPLKPQNLYSYPDTENSACPVLCVHSINKFKKFTVFRSHLNTDSTHGI
jgi:hypothetical protein